MEAAIFSKSSAYALICVGVLLLDRLFVFILSGMARVAALHHMIDAVTQPLHAKMLFRTAALTWLMLDETSHGVLAAMFAMKVLAQVNRDRPHEAIRIIKHAWANPHEAFSISSRCLTLWPSRAVLKGVWVRRVAIVASLYQAVAFLCRLAYSSPLARIALLIALLAPPPSRNARGMCVLHHAAMLVAQT
jgi:hypothetical protein